jgi:hypothetical protein
MLAEEEVGEAWSADVSSLYTSAMERGVGLRLLMMPALYNRHVIHPQSESRYWYFYRGEYPEHCKFAIDRCYVVIYISVDTGSIIVHQRCPEAWLSSYQESPIRSF